MLVSIRRLNAENAFLPHACIAWGRWCEAPEGAIAARRAFVAALITDGAGNLYGTTSSGGTYGEGTVFTVSEK
jgi:hypothetical protein